MNSLLVLSIIFIILIIIFIILTLVLIRGKDEKVCLNRVWNIQIYSSDSDIIDIDKSSLVIVRHTPFTLPYTNITIIGREICIFNDTDEEITMILNEGINISNNREILPGESITLVQIDINSWIII